MQFLPCRHGAAGVNDPVSCMHIADDSGGLRKAEEEEGIEEEDPTVHFAPRTTAADAANDTKSLDRKLAHRCVPAPLAPRGSLVWLRALSAVSLVAARL